MFTAFNGAPKIVRLFGIGNLHLCILPPLNIKSWLIGSVHEFGSPEYEALIPLEDRHVGSRSAIVLDIHKVGSVSFFFCSFFHRNLLMYC